MRKISLTLAGGFCGAIARYALGAPLLAMTASLPGGRSGLPYDTLLINLSGALALGFLLGLFEHGAPVPSGARLAIGTGFLGAYTTFSSYVVGAGLLLRQGDALAGALYLIGSMVAGVALAFAGFWLAGALWEGWRRRATARANTEIAGQTSVEREYDAALGGKRARRPVSAGAGVPEGREG